MNSMFNFKYTLTFLLLAVLTYFGQVQLKAQQPNEKESWSEFYLNLSQNYFNTNLDSSLFWGQKAEASLKLQQSDSLKIVVYLHIGEVYSALGNADTSLEYFLKARKLNDDAEIYLVDLEYNAIEGISFREAQDFNII